MPCKLHWERPFGLRKCYSSVVTPEEVAQAIQTITSDAGFDDLRYMIVDLTEAIGHDFDLQNRYALEVPYAPLIGALHTNPQIYTAFVVTHPELLQLVERKIALGLMPQPSRIFRNELEARDWLGGVSGTFRRPILF